MSDIPRPPRATYRLQLRNGVTFETARELVPYLDDLGVADLYVSPIFAARSGSSHGYDIVDPTRLDPVLGDEAALGGLSGDLRDRGMGLVVDIVPNHMSTSTENLWWRDVLRYGPDSVFAHYFDIDWTPVGDPELHGRIMLPVLGRSLDEVIDSGDLHIDSGAGGAEPVLRYFDLEFPLAPHPDGAPLRDVLAGQHYLLGHWQAGARRVNWRRFFGLTELVGVRVEDEDVFVATHSLIARLVGAGVVTGLRVDHVDGLRDPQDYLERLQGLCGGEPPDRTYPVLVEKILGLGEELPPSWPVAGTTGYEFTDTVNGVFVDKEGYDALVGFYAAFTGERRSYEQIVATNKRRVLEEIFAADLTRIVHRRAGTGGSDDALRTRTEEETVHLDVYRTYQRGEGTPSWVSDWQQLTGGVTAKAVEDTTFYEYVPLVSLCTVGSGPDSPRPDPVGYFHGTVLRRLRRWPHGLNATSTHDSKRGEDARARLDVLSEMPDEWARAVRRWSDAAAPLRNDADGAAPDRIDEFLLYQTLVGSWPPGGPTADDFADRVLDYMVKAAREAKRRTSWHDIDARYEESLISFTSRLLTNKAIMEDLGTFARRVSWHGVLNSLSQVVLRTAAPGVPDLYQGAEVWNLAMVDPDNRRPVDFDRLRSLLQELDGERADPAVLLENWNDGRIKLLVSSRALRARRSDPGLFESGDYLSVPAGGRGDPNVLAFARSTGGRWAVAVTTRLTSQLSGISEAPVGPKVWGDAELRLPAAAPSGWTDVLTGRTVRGQAGGGLALADVLGELPVALLSSG